MSPVEIGIIGFVILFILLALRTPIGVGMALVAFAGLWILTSREAAFIKLATVPFQTVSNYGFAVLPLFVLMADIVFHSEMGKDLFDLSKKWLGHLPGGLGIAAIGGCAIFSAISASSTATAITVGKVAIPEMRRSNYSPALATGSIAAGGTLGILIPPSSLLIIYGILTGTSIGKLFIAGIVPGVLLAIFYMTVIFILCKWKPSLGARAPTTSLKEKILGFSRCGEIIGLLILVLVGLMIGWFTPTEAGAVGAFGAFLFTFIRRRLNWTKLKAAFLETLKTTGMIYGILIGAFLFNYFMALSNIPFVLAEFVAGLPIPPWAIMLMIMVIYLILGCVMDAGSMVVLTIPIFFPLTQALGFDPIWFGIMVTIAMEMALITPPVAMNVYVIAGIVPDIPMQTIFKGIMPFLAADFCMVILLISVPSVALSNKSIEYQVFTRAILKIKLKSLHLLRSVISR
jgi:C4-dicarboxylate transporter DctM subunit